MLDELTIYQKYIDLIYYTNKLITKYPKSERYNLVNEIKNITYKGIRLIIEAQKDKNSRTEILNKLDTNLKYLIVLIRVSYKNKYISIKNYKTWSYKITIINNLMIGWLKVAKNNKKYI